MYSTNIPKFSDALSLEEETVEGLNGVFRGGHLSYHVLARLPLPLGQRLHCGKKGLLCEWFPTLSGVPISGK